MIRATYSGRLGNNLFQFAAAAVLARMSGAHFACDPIPGFPGTHLQERRSHEDCCGLGNELATFSHGQAWPRGATLLQLVEAARSRDVRIGGHPHRVEYFEQHRKYLIELLRPEEGEHFQSKREDIVVNVRIGDFFAPECANHFGYNLSIFGDLLDRVSFDRLILVTDSPRHEFIKRMAAKYQGIIYSDGNMMNDFRTIYGAHRLAISPSTFSWWGAWLGSSEELWFPHEQGSWKSRNDFGLMMKEPRVRFF